MNEIVNNENFSICSKCQGSCCKTMPGINHPDDFGYSKEKEIERLLKSGFYAIDWYEETRERVIMSFRLFTI